MKLGVMVQKQVGKLLALFNSFNLLHTKVDCIAKCDFVFDLVFERKPKKKRCQFCMGNLNTVGKYFLIWA